jgi:hypothetical protein
MLGDRIGRFQFTLEAIKGKPAGIRAALAGVIVVRALAVGDVIDYIGISEDFEPAPDPINAPRYKAVIAEKRSAKGVTTYTRKWEPLP